MKVIYSFKPKNDLIKVPRNSTFLDIQIQNDNIVAWLLCDPSEEDVIRFAIVETEGPHPKKGSDLKYIKTLQLYSGEVHIFEFVDPVTPKQFHNTSFDTYLEDKMPLKENRIVSDGSEIYPSVENLSKNPNRKILP